MKDEKQKFLKRIKNKTDKNKEKIFRKINQKNKASKTTKARLKFLSEIKIAKEQNKNLKSEQLNDKAST